MSALPVTPPCEPPSTNYGPLAFAHLDREYATPAEPNQQLADCQREKEEAVLGMRQAHREMLGMHRAELAEVAQQLDSLEGQWQTLIGAVLECDPIPACQRQDGHLEPPAEVVRRVRAERDSLRAELSEAQAIISAQQAQHRLMTTAEQRGVEKGAAEWSNTDRSQTAMGALGYRLLEPGEIIQAGDEFRDDNEDGRWKQVHPHGAYEKGTLFRRPITGGIGRRALHALREEIDHPPGPSILQKEKDSLYESHENLFREVQRLKYEIEAAHAACAMRQMHEICELYRADHSPVFAAIVFAAAGAIIGAIIAWGFLQ